MWPSLELCDSFLPFPPRPVFLVKESRARLPLEPFSAAQLPPPCRPGLEAAAGLEQSHIGELHVACVDATISRTLRSGYDMGAAGCGQPRLGEELRLSPPPPRVGWWLQK